MIPLSEPTLQGREWEYVKECLDTNWVSYLGPFVTRFEKAVAKVVGAKEAVATSSGTAALHTALLVKGIQPNDEVLVSDLTFIAPANAIRYVGAWPVFIDADPAYWQMDPALVASFLKNQCRMAHGMVINKKTKRRVKALMPVHILGHPCDMDALMTLARRYKLSVIEDASEALGALYHGSPVGSMGHIGCLSFNGNKTITTGGGGMLVTSDRKTSHYAKYLTTQAKEAGDEYIHRQIGYNYRLTNLQAALGCAQIERLKFYLNKKRALAARYDEGLRTIPGIHTMPEAPWAKSSFWLYTLLVNPQRFGMTSRDLHKRLLKKGIETRSLWQPLHRSPAHRGAMVVGGSVADDLWRNALSLPSTVNLTEKEQQFVIRSIRSLARRL